MLKAESFGMAVVARLAELLAEDTPWTQRLWRSGTLDALRHVQALVTNGGREGAKAWALGQLRAQVSSDPFIPPKQRGAMLKLLSVKPEKLAPASHGTRMLEELESQLAGEYWTWVIDYCKALDDSKPVAATATSADTLAWRLGAHFRSSGLSDRWIVNFANFHLKFESETTVLGDVVASARRTAESGSGWTVLVPLQSRRGFNIPPNGTFLPPDDFQTQFAILFPGADLPVNRGGLRFIIDVIDKYAAIEGINRSLAALLERHAATGTRRKLKPEHTAWVDPGGWTVEINQVTAARFRFGELDADGGSMLFATLSDELEAAIDLLLSANQASARSAVVTSWSSLETLFSDESDYGELSVVADRAAAILTCMYVREAFERLAVGHSRASSDSLANDLRGAHVTRRAALVQAAITANRTLAVNPVLGAVAVRRAADISVASILEIQVQLSNALRRLYDVRNQVVHAGAIEPYGLQVTMASAALLISAVVNETISYGRRTSGDARQLAARARWLVTSVAEESVAPTSLTGL